MRTIRLIFLISILFTSLASNCQEDIDKLLGLIERNNLEIIAINAQMEYEKANSRSELLPSNPSFEFGRFPSAMGDGVKYAWGVSQHFEFPSVYSKRLKLINTHDDYVDIQYNATRQGILLEAKHLILDIIYYKQMLVDYREREQYAKKITAEFRKRLDVGDASILDFNNANLRLLDFTLRVKEIESIIDRLNNKLMVINGNNPLEVPDIYFVAITLPSKDSIVNSAKQYDPRFQIAEIMVRLAEDELLLTKHKGLPEMEIGYASEKTDNEHFAGFKAGISIPLWGNVNKTKAAKFHLNAAKSDRVNIYSIIESEYLGAFIEAQSFYERIDDLKSAIQDKSNINNLTKAFDLGQISSIDLFQEISYYYELFDRIAEYELEYQKRVASIYRFEL